MTHERCSELLRGYVRGELPRETADEVAVHLAGCGDCRGEERALRTVALLDPGDETPLDDIERARLHRGLAQELFTSRANADVASPAREGRARTWARWAVPAATAAAVLAGALVMTLGGGLGGSDPETAQELSADAGGADSNAAEKPAAPAEGAGKGGGQRAGDTVADGEASASLAAPAGPQPKFDAHRGSLTSSDLSHIANGDLIRSIATSYRPKDGPGLYDRFLGVIMDEAVGAASEIAECAATLPEDGSLIPAYGALAQYRDDDVLVLGFVTSDPGSRRLDRSLVWVWNRSSCDQPVDTLFQKIGPR